MAKETSTVGALVVLLLAVNLQVFVRLTKANDDYNSPIWDRWLDAGRAPYLRPCLNLMKSTKCQVQLYNNYFNIRKKKMDLNCCVFVKVMGENCARRFAGCFDYPSLEVYKPNPMKLYKTCVARLSSKP
ncbi:hypothetical protein SDJN03_25890, partial [Cucurbita argyrosperma subsp. sororia]